MHSVFDERRFLIPFRATLLPQVFTDVLIVGAGAAGLRAAIAAAEHSNVIVLTKGGQSDAATAWAQGGVACAMDDDDDPALHARDTIEAGAGLCDASAVRQITSRGRARLLEMLDWGMRVDRDASGDLALAREGGHDRRRILHAGGDTTGAELLRTLWAQVATITGERVRVFDRCFALDLLTAGDAAGAPCMGALTHHDRYGLQIIWANTVILAGGGAGMVWRETTNPPVSTGDAIAMARRAGADVADMAFMQFHPTTLYVAGAARALISEAVRGEGAFLVDRAGARFMRGAHPLADLAPRDVVAKAIVDHIAHTGETHVRLDARAIPQFSKRFPSIARALAQFEIDPSRDLIPVHPAAHYTIGGVRTDLAGRTSVPGLYTIGESASVGLHGANRLASNSLLEGLVMGEITGAVCREMRSRDNAWSAAPLKAPVQIVANIPESTRAALDLADVRSSLRSAMWRNVGVIREGGKLADACEMIDFWARYTLDKVFDDPAGWQTQNMLLVAALVAQSALWRAESRGAHNRLDATDPLDEFRVHDVWRRSEQTPTLAPVEMDTEPEAIPATAGR